MVQVDPFPSPEEIQKRRKVKYIIDPRDVKHQEEERIRKWALSVMQKHEFRLTKKIRDRFIVWSEVVKPEDIDIRQIYPFHELNWIIYRDGQFWSLMLRSREKILAKFQYARLDSI
jgi:hypothetical protein